MAQRGGVAGSGPQGQGRTEVPGETGCPAGEQQQGRGQVPRTKQQEATGELGALDLLSLTDHHRHLGSALGAVGLKPIPHAEYSNWAGCFIEGHAA